MTSWWTHTHSAAALQTHPVWTDLTEELHVFYLCVFVLMFTSSYINTWMCPIRRRLISWLKLSTWRPSLAVSPVWCHCWVGVGSACRGQVGERSQVSLFTNIIQLMPRKGSWSLLLSTINRIQLTVTDMLTPEMVFCWLLTLVTNYQKCFLSIDLLIILTDAPVVNSLGSIIIDC